MEEQAFIKKKQLSDNSDTNIKKPAQAKSKFPNERSEGTTQRKQQSIIQKHSEDHGTPSTTIQKQENKTGLPNQLKSGIENLSGMDISDVKVHYNSNKPAQLNAHAYAQGSDIHVASGQEKHLPHEAWHVVQQKQGRVQPTKQMKGVNINDNDDLENEADVMGAQALKHQKPTQSSIQSPPTSSNGNPPVQNQVIQPVWVSYNLKNILMWDRKIAGLRWYYIQKDKTMYYSVQSPDDLARSLGVLEPSDESEVVTDPNEILLNKIKAKAETPKPRSEWMQSGLFEAEEEEPPPADVVNIEEVSEQLTGQFQPDVYKKIDQLESKVDSATVLSEPVESTPLHEIINDIAAQHKMTVWELELRLGSPAVYENVFKTDQSRDEVSSSGIGITTNRVSKMSSFKEYIDDLIKEKSLTGSCGQTSEWIHRVTGGLSNKKGQITPLPVKKFIEVLTRYKGTPFYIRVLSGGHSFIIENSGSKMAIYQSWHGSAPMALMLESGLKTYSPSTLISHLAKILSPKDSFFGTDETRTQTSKEVFYGQDHKDPTPLVWFNLNLEPLSKPQIIKNINTSLSKYESAWNKAMGKPTIHSSDSKQDQSEEVNENLDMSKVLGQHGLSLDVHTGLTYLHTEQMDLAEDQQSSENTKEPKFTFKGGQSASIQYSFFIEPNDLDDDIKIDQVGAFTRSIMKGNLKEGTYTHKINKAKYTMTKRGSGMNTEYTFILNT